MAQLTHRWRIIILLFGIMLAVSGCFQQVGDEPQPNVVSELVSDTPSPIPTATDTPTAEPTPEGTDDVADLGAQAVDLPVSEQEGTSVAQTGDLTNQPDTYSLTATEIVRTATQGAEISITQTAIFLGLGATPTPTMTETPTVDPFQALTPTQFFLSGADCVHEVRAGETMYRLSMYYGLPVTQIAAANAIVNPNLIVVGQRIIISGCGTTGAFPPATSTPTATAAAFGSTTGTTTDLSSLGQGGGIVTTTNTCGSSYIVQQYETLFQISLRCNVPVQSIANANGITNINRINMGDILNIPPS